VNNVIQQKEVHESLANERERLFSDGFSIEVMCTLSLYSTVLFEFTLSSIRVSDHTEKGSRKNKKEERMEVQKVMLELNELLNQKDMTEALVDSGYQTAVEMTEESSIGKINMPNIEPGSDEIPF
jgi:hypothetical protein